MQSSCLYNNSSHTVDSKDISHTFTDLPYYPTIHSQCPNNHSCGGDLICDTTCHRCKMKLGGDCAINTDCENGLICHDWKCSDPKVNVKETINEDSDELNNQSIKKNVHWNDNNEIFYI